MILHKLFYTTHNLNSFAVAASFSFFILHLAHSYILQKSKQQILAFLPSRSYWIAITGNFIFNLRILLTFKNQLACCTVNTALALLFLIFQFYWSSSSKATLILMYPKNSNKGHFVAMLYTALSYYINISTKLEEKLHLVSISPIARQRKMILVIFIKPFCVFEDVFSLYMYISKWTNFNNCNFFKKIFDNSSLLMCTKAQQKNCRKKVD